MPNKLDPKVAEAFMHEQTVLTHLRKDLGLQVYLNLELMKKTGGHTETVDADSITLLELEKIINKAIRRKKR